MISCQRDIQSGKNQEAFSSICLAFHLIGKIFFLTVAEGTFPSPVGVRQDGDFGPPATRCGDGKIAILLFADRSWGWQAIEEFVSPLKPYAD